MPKEPFIYIKLKELRKLCNENNINDKIKDATDDAATDLIRKLLPDGKHIRKGIVQDLKEELNNKSLNSSTNLLEFFQIEDLRKFCNENNLIDKVKDATDDTTAITLIKKLLPKGKDVNVETVCDYRKELNEKSFNPSTDLLEFFQIEDLRKFCDENNLREKVKDATDDNIAIALIKKLLPKGKDVDLEIVRDYRNELNAKSIHLTDGSLKSITIEELRKLCDDNNLKDKIKITTENDKVIELIKKLLPKEKAISIETIKEYKKELEKKNSSSSNDVIEDTTQEQKSVVFVNKEKALELDSSMNKIKELEANISSLITQIEDLKQMVNANNNDNNIKENKEKLLSEIPTLNELLNSCSEKITVTINKALLSKATKFVDIHSLIKLESIVRDGYDLNSTIVQSILLAFINQNSLL